MFTLFFRSPVRALRTCFAASALLALGLSACRPTPPPADPPLFTALPATQTGVDFKNTIIENLAINHHVNKYIYNGSGVALGDVNNDGLTDIFLVSNIYSCKLFLNKGGLRFEDITEKAGVAASRGYKTGAVMADINADGWLDLYVCRSHHPDSTLRDDYVFLNNRDGTFRDSGHALGIRDGAFTTQVAFLDYDLDGDLDFYQMNHPADFEQAVLVRMEPGKDGTGVRSTTPTSPFYTDKFYRNNGNGTFTEIGRQAGIWNQAFGLGLAICDVNRDGYPDVYVGNDFIEPDFLYVNNQKGGFTEQFDRYFRHGSHNTMGCDMNDVNNDGLEDLVALDMLPADRYRQKLLATSMVLDRYETLVTYGYGHQIMRNMLQINNGNGTFSDVGELAGIAKTDWSWSPLLADFDNDGHKDLFISNGIRRDMTDMDYLEFKADSLQRVMARGGSMITDQNYLDWIATIPSNPLRNFMFKNNGALHFDDQSEAWGLREKNFCTGAATADLDNDGDLDLVLNNFDDPALVYENRARAHNGAHFLTIRFNGPARNPLGHGAAVTLWVGGQQQLQVLKSTRGYLSGGPAELHFGLGAATAFDSLRVTWPDGQTQLLTGQSADQTLTLRYPDATMRLRATAAAPTLLTETTAQWALPYRHAEQLYDDFKQELLLPRRYSRLGPCLAKADLNADGLEDFFVGGGAGQPGMIFQQQPDGRWQSMSQPALSADATCEDVAAAFFDAEGDGDADLLVVGGGNEFPANDPRYQPRLYLNDGRGQLTKNTVALPPMNSSGSSIAAGDFDRDGDTDLFLGGRVTPGQYPTPPRSYLLRNEGGTFRDATAAAAPGLAQVGMVSAALWHDVDGDTWPELVLTGEWLPVSIWHNRNGQQLTDQTAAHGLADSQGWWHSLMACDADGDGDTDFIAGNFGLNTLLRASASEPLELYAADFDRNGTIDPILCHYLEGQRWPYPRKEMLLRQLPALRKQFLYYKDYAAAPLDRLLPAAELKRAQYFRANTLASSLIRNEGQGRFRVMPLPDAAQWSPVNAICPWVRPGQTGPPLLLLAGNCYENEIEIARVDAGNGVVLQQQNGGLMPLPLAQSGFFAAGNARALLPLTLANGRQAVLVANNSGGLQVFQ
jgi:enediyne biosynthesis protein E4